MFPSGTWPLRSYVMSENIISFANDMKDSLPLIMSVCQQQQHYGHDSNLERGLMDVNGEI